MGLDEYRLQVIESLKNCQTPGRARELLAEVDLVLKSSQLSAGTQGMFWQTLSSDLDLITQDSPLLLEKQAAAALIAVVAVAQRMIVQYQRGGGGVLPNGSDASY